MSWEPMKVVVIAYDPSWMKMPYTWIKFRLKWVCFSPRCYDDDENMPEMHLDETLDNAGGAAGIGAVVSVAKSGNTDLGVGPHESPMMAN